MFPQENGLLETYLQSPGAFLCLIVVVGAVIIGVVRAARGDKD